MNVCVRMNDHAMEKKKRGSVKLARWLQRRVRRALTGYVRVGSGSDISDGAGVTCMVYPTTPYLSLGSGLSRSINFGRPDVLSLMEIP